LADTPDEVAQRGIRAIARRVTTLAQVYDHLLGNEITRTTDFGTYAVSLCRSLAEIRGVPDSAVTLTCDSTQVMLDLDAVTALGIILAELVTNSYDHAFPDGTGSIAVAVRAPAGDDSMASMTVLDSGPGFDAKAENKRHGLGLVRRLAEQVRGTRPSIHIAARFGPSDSPWPLDRFVCFSGPRRFTGPLADRTALSGR
jgi:two-component sensor histidine kinase